MSIRATARLTAPADNSVTIQLTMSLGEWQLLAESFSPHPYPPAQLILSVIGQVVRQCEKEVSVIVERERP